MLARTLLIFLAAAAAAAAPASARSTGQNELVVNVAPPLVFTDSTFACPAGGATFPASSTAGRGQGVVCFLTATPTTPCSVDACQVLTATVTIYLPGGVIAIDTEQFEADTFDPVSGAFTVDLSFDGVVTHATQRYHKLVGAAVGGGGTTVFAADGSIATNVAYVIDGA